MVGVLPGPGGEPGDPCFPSSRFNPLDLGENLSEDQSVFLRGRLHCHFVLDAGAKTKLPEGCPRTDAVVRLLDVTSPELCLVRFRGLDFSVHPRDLYFDKRLNSRLSAAPEETKSAEGRRGGEKEESRDDLSALLRRILLGVLALQLLIFLGVWLATRRSSAPLELPGPAAAAAGEALQPAPGKGDDRLDGRQAAEEERLRGNPDAIFLKNRYIAAPCEDMSRVGGVNKGLFRGVDTDDKSRIVVKKTIVQFERSSTREKIAGMLAKRRSRISNIGKNVLGFKDYVFCQEVSETVLIVYDVMENYGFGTGCVLRNALEELPEACSSSSWSNSAFTNKHKAGILLGILRAIQQMQKATITAHRDIKSFNALLPPSALDLSPAQLADAVRVIDFDAVLFDDDDVGEEPRRTLGFQPAEVYDLGLQDEATRRTMLRTVYDKVDVFSAGVTFLELLLETNVVSLFEGMVGPSWRFNPMSTADVLAWCRLMRRLPDSDLVQKAKQFGQTERRILEGLLHPNPKERWAPESAITQVENYCCTK